MARRDGGYRRRPQAAAAGCGRMAGARVKKLCTVPSVKRMVEDAEAIIRDLAKQSVALATPSVAWATAPPA